MSHEKAQEIFASIDVKADGMIDYEEFCKGVLNMALDSTTWNPTRRKRSSSKASQSLMKRWRRRKGNFLHLSKVG